jgi:hypothetical protein
MMGLDEFDQVMANVQHLVDNRRRLSDHPPSSALGLPWIVPHLQRSPDTCADIDGFFDRWLGWLGCAVIDPEPQAEPDPDPDPDGDPDATGDRLLPTPVPARVAEDLDRHTSVILSDGNPWGGRP